MKVLLILIVTLVTTTSIVVQGAKHPTSEKSDIVTALLTEDRTSVYIGMWTLQQNGLSFADDNKIDILALYKEALPKLILITNELEKLSEDELDKLDKSLKYHRSIFSPIWAGTGWNDIKPLEN